jgi:hypothetical protein
VVHFTCLRQQPKQQTDYWSTKNRDDVHEVPLHVSEVGVWWKTTARRVTGSVYFHEILNSERCGRLIISPFLDQLTDEEKFYGHFMQDNAKVNAEKKFYGCIK